MSATTITPPPTPQPQPTAARMTAEEFGLKYSGDHVEYVNGQVKEIPMAGGMHSAVCNLIAFYLTQHVLPQGLGRVLSNDAFIKVPTKDDPERVYGADVCFFSYARMPKEVRTPMGVIALLPELAIEVKSPRDTWSYVFGKVGDYLTAGVTVVLVLDPERSTASTYRNDDSNPQEIFKTGDTLTLPDILPGFTVPVAALFA